CNLFGMEFLRRENSECVTDCDKIFIMGDEIKMILEQRGAKNVYAYGVPRFKYLFDLNAKRKFTLNKKEGFTITYIVGAWSWHGNAVANGRQNVQLKFLVDFVRQNQQFYLIIRNHPRQDRSEYHWLQEDIPSVEFVPAEADLESILRISDVTLTMGSLVFIESIALNVPSLMVDFPIDPKHPNFGEVYDLPVIKSEQELANILRDLACSDRKQQKELIKKQHELLDRIIAPTTPTSDIMIAKEILSSLHLQETKKMNWKTDEN
ncbi:MAG: hypothetical protein WBW71_12425, partial [Bacteroidota bacterium]